MSHPLDGIRKATEHLALTLPITMADVVAVWEICKPAVPAPYKLDVTLDRATIVVRVFYIATGKDDPCVFARTLVAT